MFHHRSCDGALLSIELQSLPRGLLNLSFFILFVDLVKAFDKVIRQLVMGWGRNKPTDTVAYLCSFGVSDTSAVWISQYIDGRGAQFAQWLINSTAADLVQSIHAGAWFRVGSSEFVITFYTGGRQGCKLGGIVFNNAYAIALDFLSWELSRARIAFRVAVPTGAFWDPPDPENGDFECVVDAAFVDDECLVLMASSPAQLNCAIDVLFKVLLLSFSNVYFEINWKPGKTEALLCY